MIQDIGEHIYDNHFEPHDPTPRSYVLCYRDATVLCRIDGETIDLPCLRDFATASDLQYLFSIDGMDFFTPLAGTSEEPEGFSYQTLNWLRFAEPQYLLFAAVTGWQLFRWYESNRYCGRCGHPTQIVPTSREVCCPACNAVIYPKIAPGVIVGVVDPATERIVLTKYAGREHAHFALVAGFTEIGESIEQTVAREVMEEAGVRVRDIRYWGSQPWGFASDLLLGFVCDLDGDPEIHRADDELSYAEWVPREEIFEEEDHISLTRAMVCAFKRGEL